MTAIVLTQFLIDVTRGHRRQAFASDREAVIGQSKLDEGLRTAVRDEDMATLWRAGAHPMALLYFARLSGWAAEDYYRCIEAAAAC
ncbi:MAG: hypothetical protein ABIS28_00135 [Caldimonas sp.]